MKRKWTDLSYFWSSTIGYFLFLFILLLKTLLKIFLFCKEFKKLILGNSMFNFIHKILICSRFPPVYHSVKVLLSLLNTLNYVFIHLYFLFLLIANSIFFTNIIHFLYKIYKIKTSTYSLLEFMADRVPQRLSFKKWGGRKHWQESPVQSNSFFLENCGY